MRPENLKTMEQQSGGRLRKPTGIVRGIWRGFLFGLAGSALLCGAWLCSWAEPPLMQQQSSEASENLTPRTTPECPILQEGNPTSGVLHLAEGRLVQFRVQVPKEALLVSFQISRCPVPVDVLVKKAEPMDSANDADYHFTADLLQDTVRISRLSTPPLEEGNYYVAVAHLGPKPVVVHKRTVSEIPFTITFQVVRARAAIRLECGQKYTGQVRADHGSIQTFLVEVPPEAPALRIDLDEVSSDLDLWASFGQPVFHRSEAANTAFSPMGRETLLITPQSPEPLRPGRWYIHVAHPEDEGVVDFALYVTFASEPPAGLLTIPHLPIPEDSLQRAIAATVEVATEYGAASGTLVTATGLVLTNYHVVAEVADPSLESAEPAPVIIAVTMDPTLPPKELFRGRVVWFNKERDLALVQITCGLYYQPLPKDYRFPTVPLGDPSQMRMGDEVRIVGFPSVGGSGARVSVTLTRGIVSGFEKAPIGVLMKTDALIAPGSSGGAALDRLGRLIGVPTSENVLPEAVGRMSYIHPLTMLPENWWKLISSASLKP
ncbi:MAG: serine protease [Thermoguttaceae bacterium]|nr:serine protease [Thermoguttaceae bacterium]MDW8036897.1 serine protease [Thermoguttaceae bacterium]